MKCTQDLVNDINRFYYLFDNIYIRHYDSGLSAIFAPYQQEVDIYLQDECIAFLDKYKVLHICTQRVKANNCANRIMNELSAGLDSDFSVLTY